MIIPLLNVTFLEPGTFLPGSNSDMKTFYSTESYRSAGLALSYDTSTQLITMSSATGTRILHGSRARDMVPAKVEAGAPKAPRK